MARWLGGRAGGDNGGIETSLAVYLEHSRLRAIDSNRESYQE